MIETYCFSACFSSAGNGRFTRGFQDTRGYTSTLSSCRVVDRGSTSAICISFAQQTIEQIEKLAIAARRTSRAVSIFTSWHRDSGHSIFPIRFLLQNQEWHAERIDERT